MSWGITRSLPSAGYCNTFAVRCAYEDNSGVRRTTHRHAFCCVHCISSPLWNTFLQQPMYFKLRNVISETHATLHLLAEFLSSLALSLTLSRTQARARSVSLLGEIINILTSSTTLGTTIPHLSAAYYSTHAISSILHSPRIRPCYATRTVQYSSNVTYASSTTRFRIRIRNRPL